uniref:Uncharacterized protein LOC111122781 n=1 Tax=Crassostrea virginica TaxID=6565 RepID=A0A8B8CX90_CRAVI|nr:uncharacterized protein LOC111122781 [Crassostrea virginica]XP_022320419.1 uncharacterized protein LOC111122781 [Crassostrea virginica]
MVKTLTPATSKHAEEYRKFTASISTPEVCKVFFKEESEFLQKTFPQYSSGSKLKDYINVCIEQMWLMCVQDPQMSLGFAAYMASPSTKNCTSFMRRREVLYT